mmetsp:Transcript_1038/g.1646  ORF Transcript_1038/g.1646 Transcript_1038/m.1646 type:complete len:567 (+) Transcript_1038:27-1727(+)
MEKAVASAMCRLESRQAEQERDFQVFICQQYATIKNAVIFEYTEMQKMCRADIDELSAAISLSKSSGYEVISPPLELDTGLQGDATMQKKCQFTAEDITMSQAISEQQQAEIDEVMKTRFPNFNMYGASATEMTIAARRVDNTIDKHVTKLSICHEFFHLLGIGYCCSRTEMPSMKMAQISQSTTFNALCTLVIVANTIVMGYESDVKIRAVMQNPPDSVPQWLSFVRVAFTIFYCCELLFRIVALRSWFFAHKEEWIWNAFDLILVSVSVMTEAFSGLNFSFVRVVRALRIIRVARVVRVFRVFRSLREMFLSILACLPSLAWAFTFTAVWMFMFSVFILQGAYEYLDSLTDAAEREIVQRNLEKYYSSLDNAMLTLLGAITGGEDWFSLREPLVELGGLYTGAFMIYVLVVTIGFLHILIGIFAGNTATVRDRDLAVHKEDSKLDQFVQDMVDLFKEFEVDSSGKIDVKTFMDYVTSARVQSYLASHELDSTHANLLFQLLDQDKSGSIDIREWIVGLMKLKGPATALDARIIERDLAVVKGQIESMKKVAASTSAPKFTLAGI